MRTIPKLSAKFDNLAPGTTVSVGEVLSKKLAKVRCRLLLLKKCSCYHHRFFLLYNSLLYNQIASFVQSNSFCSTKIINIDHAGRKDNQDGRKEIQSIWQKRGGYMRWW